MRRTATKKEMDLLNGNIVPMLLSFALPLALTNMLQQLFNAADIAVLGQFAGKNAMAAVGSTAAIVGLIVNLFAGISIGANVIIANFTGQHNRKKVSEATHTAILLAVICGFIIAVLGNVLAAPMVHLLGTPEVIAPMSIKYLRIYFGGMPIIMLYNFEAAIFRSQGDTRTPLICLAFSGVLNICLNIAFVVGLRMDVDGVAIATVSSNFVSAMLLLFFLTRNKGAIRVRRESLRISTPLMKSILRIGVPSGLQGMVFSLSNLVIQSAVNSLGPDVIAGSSAAFNLEIFGFFILNSFGQAAVTFIGQNYGAGNIRRCREITRKTLIVDEIFTMAVAGLLILFGRELLALFNSDPNVIAFGYTRVVVLLGAEFLNVVIEVLSGSMRGYGRSMTPAIVTFIGICGTRIIYVYTIFAASPTWRTLMAAYPISWTITMCVMIFAYIRVRKSISVQREAAE